MKLFAEVDSELSPLSKRENQVFTMLAEGLSQREMSDRLHRSFATISTHIDHIKTKLDADNSTQAVSIGFANGFLKVRNMLVMSLILASSVSAVLPAPVFASTSTKQSSTENPFVRTRVRGGSHVKTGTQLQLRTSTRIKGTG